MRESTTRGNVKPMKATSKRPNQPPPPVRRGTIYTTTRPTPDNPRAEDYALAQLVRPPRRCNDQPTIAAERYIRHGRMDAESVALACFQRWGLMRKGLAVRCLPVTVGDLGMTEIPA